MDCHAEQCLHRTGRRLFQYPDLYASYKVIFSKFTHSLRFSHITIGISSRANRSKYHNPSYQTKLAQSTMWPNQQCVQLQLGRCICLVQVRPIGRLGCHFSLLDQIESLPPTCDLSCDINHCDHMLLYCRVEQSSDGHYNATKAREDRV